MVKAHYILKNEKVEKNTMPPDEIVEAIAGIPICVVKRKKVSGVFVIVDDEGESEPW